MYQNSHDENIAFLCDLVINQTFDKDLGINEQAMRSLAFKIKQEQEMRLWNL